MSSYPFSVRRLILAGGFAAAVVAAPMVAVFTVPTANPPVPLAACTSGEEEDVYTTVCTPLLVPNSPSPFTSIPGNPDIPAIDGIPCTGRNAGQCIGLAEDAEAAGPQPVPRSTISSSP
jgi:hypothetical protein